MKKKFIKAGTVAVFTLLILVLASGVKAEYVENGNQVQNQNEVRTLNQGDEDQLVVQNQEQESLGEARPETVPAGANRSVRAQERMSVVAQRVQALLATEGAQGGIGDQVRQIAQEQQQAQEEMRLELNKIDERGNFLKRLIGPNYGAIKRMEQQVEQNQLRIQQLNQLQTQLTNQAEEAQVQEMVQALIEQNTALQERMGVEKEGFSMLGWLFRLFA